MFFKVSLIIFTVNMKSVAKNTHIKRATLIDKLEKKKNIYIYIYGWQDLNLQHLYPKQIF